MFFLSGIRSTISKIASSVSNDMLHRRIQIALFNYDDYALRKIIDYISDIKSIGINAKSLTGKKSVLQLSVYYNAPRCFLRLAHLYSLSEILAQLRIRSGPNDNSLETYQILARNTRDSDRYAVCAMLDYLRAAENLLLIITVALCQLKSYLVLISYSLSQ